MLERLLIGGGEDGQVDLLEPAIRFASSDQRGIPGDLQPADGGLVDPRHPLLREAAQVLAGQVVALGGDRGIHPLL